MIRSLLLVAALTVAIASPAAAALYRWIDTDGVIHYTDERDSIPERYRTGAELLEAPGARASESSGASEPARAPDPSALPAPAAPGIPVSPGGGPLIVDAHLNGVPLRLLVDTGADRTVIAPAALSRAGYDTTRGAPVQITGVTGSAVAVLVPIQRLDVAGAQVGPLSVVAHPVPGDGVDGLLGRDVLDAFSVTVDSTGNGATLAPR